MTLSIMPAFWWHFLESGRMSSLRLADSHRVEQRWQALISPPLFLQLFSVPPVDFYTCRPATTLKKQNEDPWNEMTNTRLSLWHSKWKAWWRENKKEGGARQPKQRTVMRSVWLLFTADGHINLTAIKSGQAFTTGGHQMQLRPQIAPWRHVTL